MTWVTALLCALMAIAVDGSAPIRWSGIGASGAAATSAAFTAPTDALLVCCVQADGDGAHSEAITVSDSGGLSWTKQVERTWAESTTGGQSAIWTSRTVSSVSRTVTVSMTFTGGTNFRRTGHIYVLTGVDVNGTPVDTVGASNEGGSTTNSINTSSITPGANGLLVVSDCDWSAAGAFQSSSDLTQESQDFAGAISVCDGYKTSTSGVGVTGNLNAAGTGAVQHKWCQITVREAAGGGGVTVKALAALGVG